MTSRIKAPKADANRSMAEVLNTEVSRLGLRMAYLIMLGQKKPGTVAGSLTIKMGDQFCGSASSMASRSRSLYSTS